MSEGSTMVRVALLDPDTKDAAAAQDVLNGTGRIEVVACIADEAALAGVIDRTHPDVVVLDVSALRTDVATMLRELLIRVPECCVLVTGVNVPANVVLRAVTAGARGFLLKPYDKRDLVTTIDEAWKNLQDLRRLQRSDRPHGRGPRGAIIAVYSPKGGVGCTTIATNLAVALVGRPKRRVALVDLDMQFGDVGVALNIRGTSSVVDLLAHADGIDRTVVDDVFVRHESDVRVLPAPDSLAFVESIDAERVVRTLDLLREHFDFIICDLWSSLDDLTVGVLRAADRILLVTTPELPSLRNVKRAISATVPVLMDERTLVVANRLPGKAGVNVAGIERGLGRKIAATIPSEGIGVTEAINQGLSIFDPRVRARIGRSFRRLADLVERDLGAHRAEPAIAGATLAAVAR